MVDQSVPPDPQHGADNGEKSGDQKLRAVAERAKKDRRRENAKRFANAAGRKLKIALVWMWRRLISLDFWMMAATVTMAITTIVYTHYAKKQWQEMHDSGAQTDQLICLYRQQLEKLQSQIDTADTANQISRDAQRPWVGIVIKVNDWAVSTTKAPSAVVFFCK